MGDDDVSAVDGALAACLGLVYDDVKRHGAVLRGLLASPFVSGVEFSVQAPIYKGSPQIKAALEGAEGLRDKIDLYFRLAIVDESERVRYAHLFAAQYARKHPRVERQDLFQKSGDVFGFSFDLVPPMQLDTPRVVFDAIAAGPHDAALLARLRGGESPERWQLKVCVRLFLDHVLNPRRHGEAAVKDAAAVLGVAQPCVIEVSASPAVAGYARHVLEPLVDDAGGCVVWLDA
jgi:hypothetical protein